MNSGTFRSPRLCDQSLTARHNSFDAYCLWRSISSRMLPVYNHHNGVYWLRHTPVHVVMHPGSSGHPGPKPAGMPCHLIHWMIAMVKQSHALKTGQCLAAPDRATKVHSESRVVGWKQLQKSKSEAKLETAERQSCRAAVTCIASAGENKDMRALNYCYVKALAHSTQLWFSS